MRFETLFFDLDDTVYLPNSGIWEAIGDRMVQYMVSKLGIPETEAPIERNRLFTAHGTTMRGLVTEYHIDDVEFLEYVHDIPINQYLSENKPLRAVLEKYEQRKVVFTNGDTNHANRVLNALGIRELFSQIVDIRSIKPWCKPQPEAFTKAFELAGIRNPSSCVLIDDALRNLVTAHDFGLYTIQVGAQELAEPVNAIINTLEELPQVLPW